MINGDVNDFVNRIHYGEELIFEFQNRELFIQGRKDNGTYNLYITQWTPPSEEYVWVGIGDEKNFPVEKFLQAKIFNGKTFWEVEHEIEWTDP